MLDVQYAGSASEASAGPGSLGGQVTTLDASGYAIYTYLTAHRDGASYLLAVENWPLAGAVILATGQEVLSMGGFTGSVPEPTLVRVKQLVSTGQLRFIFLKGTDGTGAGRGTGGGSNSSAMYECAGHA